LAEVLRARGARVDYCEVYQRCFPSTAAQELHDLFASSPHGRIRVVTVHSGETLENFVKILRLWPKSFAESAYNAALLTPSERVAQVAREQGFLQVKVADNATDEAMLKALFNLN
jgi:uroporphyrinogen-III synthase